MRPSRRNPKTFGKFSVTAVAVVFFLAIKVHAAETVTLHLRTGERIAGAIVSENTNCVVVSNFWASGLSIPLAQVEKRETNVVASLAKISPTTTNPPAATTNMAAKTTSPAVVVAATAISKTNAPSAQPKTAKPKLWRADVQFGVDLLYGRVDRKIYNTRFKLTYARPYANNPGKFFRNTLDYLYEYGETQVRTVNRGVTKTDTVLSANRMEGSDKTDFDIGKKVFVYNQVGAGYDEIRKIDLRYEAGPGVGYHLFALTNFVANVESGANYQVQYRTVGEDTENFYYRLAEDLTWKLHPKITLTEKFEYFPRAGDLSEYRARFESRLSFQLLKNLSFNFSVIDLYDTQPAPNVSKNELQVRSTIGVTF